MPPGRECPRVADFHAVLALSITAALTRLSRDLWQRGFCLLGSNTAYAFMQAVGLDNDYVEGCSLRQWVEKERRVVSARHRLTQRRSQLNDPLENLCLSERL